MTATAIGWITPDWPVAEHVRVLATLRAGGVSEGPYASLNLAAHVGDLPDAVAANRLLLREAARVPAEPRWLEQVHGTNVVQHQDAEPGVQADACVAFTSGRVCAVLTADCLPVVFADQPGTRVAVAHAGWRGLAAGILESTIAVLNVPACDLHAWLGPAIGRSAFEVGAEVHGAFVARVPGSAACFIASDRGRYQADLYGLAQLVLQAAGLRHVHGGGWCTHGEAARFFSYRRDGVTGRQATLAWLA